MPAIMQTTILIKAPGLRSNSPAQSLSCIIRSQFLTVARKAIRAIFSEKGSIVAAAAVIAMMTHHVATTTDTIASQRAVAIDCLCLLPWGIAYIVRSLSSKKGGEA